MQKDEIVLQFIAEGGSIEIIKSHIENNPVFFLTINECAFGKDENRITKIKHSTFVRAFASLDEKYQWYDMHINSIKECYKEIMHLKLVEHRQKSSFDEERYRYAGR